MSAIETPVLLNPHPAIEYVKYLFKPGDHIFYFLIHSTNRHRAYDGSLVADVKCTPLLSYETAVKPAAIQKLEDYQAEGWNVYVCMNPFPEGTTERKEKLIEVVRNVFIESDQNKGGADTLELIRRAVVDGVIPAPHSILQSSPGNYHITWNVDGIGPATAKMLNRALAARFDGDPHSTDLHRVLRLPGFRNLKYANKPMLELLDHHPDVDAYTLADFKSDIGKPTNYKPGAALSDDKLAKKIDYFETNFKIAKVDAHYAEHDDNFRWTVECPWASSHTWPTKIAEAFLWRDGGYGFHCFHGHCAEKHWPEFRDWMNLKANQNGHKVPLVWGSIEDVPENERRSPAMVIPSELSSAVVQSTEARDLIQEDTIPEFNAAVINGIYREIVDLVCDGTTIPRQFVFLFAKVCIGARMAGKVTFEGLDSDSRYYGAAIGETGTSKGLSWRRGLEVIGFEQDGMRVPVQTKVINAVDSGAGLKDCFFEYPPLPIIFYVDEIATLGHQNNEKKQPEIVDNMISLADMTQVSRVLAKTKQQKASRSTAAYLSVYMCGQDGPTYTAAFAGRTKLGFFDRLYPEFSYPIEAGDLPDIDREKALETCTKIERLDFSGKMTMAPGVKTKLDEFWKAQQPVIRQKVRFKKHLMLDMYMSAFGRGLKMAEMSDLAAAIEIFNRQILIRKVCFTFEVPDRVGYYVGLLKKITESMRARLIAGEPVGNVAMSLRDFQTATNAYRDNELQVFNIAWKNFQAHIAATKVVAANGHTYNKFVPEPNETETWSQQITKGQ